MTAAASSDGGSDYDFDLFTLGGGTAGVRASRLSATMGTPLLSFHLVPMICAFHPSGQCSNVCVVSWPWVVKSRYAWS